MEAVGIMDKLNESLIESHLPNMVTGICTAPYTVVKDMGQFQELGNFAGSNNIEVLIYVPRNNYAGLATLKKAIKDSLVSEESLRRTGYEQPVVYLDSTKSYMSSIEYKILKKL